MRPRPTVSTLLTLPRGDRAPAALACCWSVRRPFGGVLRLLSAGATVVAGTEMTTCQTLRRRRQFHWKASDIRTKGHGRRRRPAT
jgi:hypothetical protein